jgi:hypothetical protein
MNDTCQPISGHSEGVASIDRREFRVHSRSPHGIPIYTGFMYLVILHALPGSRQDTHDTELSRHGAPLRAQVPSAAIARALQCAGDRAGQCTAPLVLGVGQVVQGQLSVQV